MSLQTSLDDNQVASLLKSIDNAVKSVFDKYYTAFDYDEVMNNVNHISYSDEYKSENIILVNRHDPSASYMYNSDIFRTRIINEWLSVDIDEKTVSDTHRLDLSYLDKPIHILNPYSDSPENNDDFFQSFAFILEGFVYVVDIKVKPLSEDDFFTSTGFYRTCYEMPISAESIDGKGIYYMSRTSGISLRVNDLDAWEKVPVYMRHGMAKLWNPSERIFLLTEEL